MVDQFVVIADSHLEDGAGCGTCAAIRDALAASVVVLWQISRLGAAAVEAGDAGRSAQVARFEAGQERLAAASGPRDRGGAG